MSLNPTILNTLKASLEDRLQDWASEPRPTYTIDGQTVDWNAYGDLIKAQLQWVDEQLALTTGPYEIVTEVL